MHVVLGTKHGSGSSPQETTTIVVRLPIGGVFNGTTVRGLGIGIRAHDTGLVDQTISIGGKLKRVLVPVGQ